jgi:hypothetical protein
VIDCLLAQGADYTIANAKGISGRDLMLQNISYQDLVKRYDLGQPSEQATAGQVRDISDKATPVIELSPDMKTSTEALETEISGRVSDPSGMDAFFIDNIRVSLSPSGQFLKKVALAVGNNSFHLKAVDRQGKETVQTVSILRQAVGDALWSSPVPAAQLHGEKRVALIIGNSAYRSSPLRNPVNDAADLGRVLKTLGFDTDIQTDADKRDMLSAIDRFDRQLQDADVGLFFYAGHGMQVSGNNYLIPISARISNETDIELEGIDIRRVMGRMDRAVTNVNIVFLDACRDNPFHRRFRSTSRGFTQMDAAKGTFIAYSTAPGQLADDGTDRNSPFTAHLLTHIATPDIPIEKLLKLVRLGVI